MELSLLRNERANSRREPWVFQDEEIFIIIYKRNALSLVCWLYLFVVHQPARRVPDLA